MVIVQTAQTNWSYQTEPPDQEGDRTGRRNGTYRDVTMARIASMQPIYLQLRQAREDVCVIEMPLQEMGRRAAAMLNEHVRDPARPPRQEILNLDPEQVRERIFSYRQRVLHKVRRHRKEDR